MNNLKKFATEAEYTAAIGSLDYPNVSWIESGDTLHYNLTEPQVKFLAKNGNTVLKTVYCDGNQLTTGDTQTGYETSAMTDAIISDCVTSLADWTFFTGGENDFASLSSVTVPNTVTQIPSEFVRYCTALKSFDIPSGTTRIAWEAFKDSGIEELTIPSGVTEIEAPALDMPSATSITCLATVPPTLTYVAMTQYLTGITIYVPSASVSAYQAAEGWSGLTISAIPEPPHIEAVINATGTRRPTIIVGNSIGLFGLSKIIIDNVELPTPVTEYTFSTAGDHTVKYVMSVDHQNEVPYGLFKSVSVKSAIMPDNITLVYTDAFNNTYNTNSLTFNSTVPPELMSNALVYEKSAPTIYVPAASVDAYKAASGWSTYASNITAIV